MRHAPSLDMNAPPAAYAEVYARFADGPSTARRVTASGQDAANLRSEGAPHDLDSRIPGLNTLRCLTQGDPRITIVVLDGDPDLRLACLRDSRVTKTLPYWHTRARAITAEEHALFREIMDSDLSRDEKGERLLTAFSRETLLRIEVDRHATLIASIIVGQPGTPVPGIAPGCRLVVVPIDETGDPDELLSPLNLARAFDLAHGLGADIIHCSVCVPTQTDAPHELLAKTVQRCVEDNIMIVAPAGNNGSACRCLPAVLPGTLAVGALKADGTPLSFSNWGGYHAINGIMAPGEQVLGAQPGTDETIREIGTSVAAPIVTAVSALLMSRCLHLGRPINAAAIRSALLDTVRDCDPGGPEPSDRCLRGVLNLPAALDILFAPLSEGPSSASGGIGGTGVVPASADPARLPTRVAGSVEPSTAHSGLVYALGSLSYDFGSEIGGHEFEQYMEVQARAKGAVPGTPYQTSDLIAYLEANRTERDCLIWTLMIDGAPIYGMVPDGPFDDAIYDTFLQILAAQSLAPDDPEFIERISVPGRRTGSMIQLRSKARIPILTVTDLRGIYGWKINTLVADAVSRIHGGGETAESLALHAALTCFLNRVYFDLHNLGQKSRDRAMNFATTNIFQASDVFAAALRDHRELDTIFVQRSPVCRMHSDCWDISLTFVDPNNQRRAAKIFEFTIDVSDLVPVTVGPVKSWMKRRE